MTEFEKCFEKWWASQPQANELVYGPVERVASHAAARAAWGEGYQLALESQAQRGVSGDWANDFAAEFVADAEAYNVVEDDYDGRHYNRQAIADLARLIKADFDKQRDDCLRGLRGALQRVTSELVESHDVKIITLVESERALLLAKVHLGEGSAEDKLRLAALENQQATGGGE